MSASTIAVLEDAARAFGRVLQHGAGLGQDLVRSLWPSDAGGCPCGRPGCACEMPPPCWMPRPLCPVTSTGCAGSAARVRLRITNCGPAPRRVSVQALNGANGVTIEPAALGLGPYEREFVAVSAALPAGAARGEEREIVLLVRGCRDHVLRWTVKVASSESCSCGVVEVDDCPDHTHHWYDHFHCARDCSNGR